jgi:hypothetical protein
MLGMVAAPLSAQPGPWHRATHGHAPTRCRRPLNPTPLALRLRRPVAGSRWKSSGIKSVSVGSSSAANTALLVIRASRLA